MRQIIFLMILFMGCGVPDDKPPRPENNVAPVDLSSLQFSWDLSLQGDKTIHLAIENSEIVGIIDHQIQQLVADPFYIETVAVYVKNWETKIKNNQIELRIFTSLFHQSCAGSCRDYIKIGVEALGRFNIKLGPEGTLQIKLDQLEIKATSGPKIATEYINRFLVQQQDVINKKIQQRLLKFNNKPPRQLTALFVFPLRINNSSINLDISEKTTSITFDLATPWADLVQSTGFFSGASEEEIAKDIPLIQESMRKGKSLVESILIVKEEFGDLLK